MKYLLKEIKSYLEFISNIKQQKKIGLAVPETILF